MTSAIRPSDEMANVITHGVGFVLSVPGVVYLNQQVASQCPSMVIACGVYSVTLLLTYGFSTLSHLFYDIAWRRRFRTLDQASIFLLIAGSYTPFAVMYRDRGSWPWLLMTMWLLACVGVSRVLQVRDLSRTDKVLYGLMGFLPVVGLARLAGQAPTAVITWIVAGGACYALGSPFLRISASVRYSHALWHILVMAGSACHYWAILLAVENCYAHSCVVQS